VDTYLHKYADDLQRVWEVERPFELHLPTAIISGRADVILDKEGGEVRSLAIVDYKTSTEADDDHGLQLAVYTDAGRREGLDVRAAYVHDLSAADRQPVDVSGRAVAECESLVEASVADLRRRDFHPKPGRPCKRCDMRKLCRWAAAEAS
jgi:DNA helicase-2/ATP-dependent DNA helicase PcrA